MSLHTYCRVALLAFMIGCCGSLLAQSDVGSPPIAVSVQTYNEAGHLRSPYRYQVRKISNKPDGTQLPAVIFCHGSGGGVKDFPPAEKEIEWQRALSQNGDSFYFFTPKSGTKSGSLSADGLEQFIGNVVANYDVDPRKISIVGYSAGSGSVTSTAVNKGHLIKSAIVIEGGFRGTVPDDHTLAGLPIWVFHNENDQRVALDRGESFVNTAREAGADVRFTVNPDGEHKIQISRNLTPEIVKWIFGVTGA
ncbi:dienelactone hydrolase family protein [Aporhodopirellula aestuarii]|uniref:Dienelactone hydrolase family protein n=1 Tax=Aporhodopirellula aestuarii TaxID=2950107 RepID=A0ABT0U6S0_9BACT|nr:dienelactone hydrolase family protein [Aporhodopirellula aestuarii]MCM2372657.1 dienelactone hydrolase family protein [Aporhodopirellula aestuarii]